MNKNNKSTLRRIIATLGMVLMLSLSLTGMTQPAQAKTSSAITLPVTANLTVSKQSVTLGGNSCSTTFTVSNVQSYTVTSSSSWIHVSKSNHTVTIRVDVNDGDSIRYGSVTVKSGSETCTVSVKQHRKIKVYAGSNYTSLVDLRVYVGVANYIDPPQESFKVVTSGGFTATPSNSWLTVTTSGSYITIKATPNTTQEQRRGYVKITNGYETVNFQIIQQAIVPYSMTLYPYMGPNSFSLSTSLKNGFGNIKSSNWSSLTIANQRDLLNSFIPSIRQFYGLPSSLTITFAYNTRASLNATYSSILGKKPIGSDERGRTKALGNGKVLVLLNADKCKDSTKVAVETILHEFRHVYQMCTARYSGNMYQYLCMYNLTNYIESPYADYKNQFVEKDAFTYSEKLYSALNSAVK